MGRIINYSKLFPKMLSFLLYNLIFQLSIFMKPELKLSHEVVSIDVARIDLHEYETNAAMW